MTTTVYKDESRYIEISTPDDCQYRVKLPSIPNGIFALEEMTDDMVVNEIDFFIEDVEDLVNGLLDAKRDYVNEFC